MTPEKGMYDPEVAGARKEQNPYFKPEYVAGRHAVIERFKEYREKIEKGDLPKPAQDWEVIWALTGPDQTLEEGAKIHKGEEQKATSYNQTRRRFETALAVAREVTAVRLSKEVSEVTDSDIEKEGPVIYWSGKASTNDYLAQLIEAGEFEKQFHFPSSCVKITENRDIQHTGHQFAEFPKELLPEGKKVVIISDVYHLPRG
ncbi:MAG: hypothetical protein UY50_C0011G0003 [Parcubacteria group bacterium GW2011_GWA2_49_9]|nr:MAG: hypothetical protein UY50_C0011G0003 [Parcubacteria group bacterium GW2011_GWA2_49_9]